MATLNSRRGLQVGALLAIGCIGLAAAGCGSSPSSTSSSKVSGTANVAFASSLQYLNAKVAGPAFTKATGYKFSGTGGASGTLESEIAAKALPDTNVFEAVGSDNIMPLEPKFTHWYVQYAANKMVIAYNPKSKYASQFAAIASGKEPMKDLFTLLETSGLKLGRTDPNIDPQGRYFIEMLELAQMYYHLPSDTVAKILGTSTLNSSTSSEIYAESSLDSVLQAGGVDAASAYYTQAIELHLDYIPLPDMINMGNPADTSFYSTAHITTTNGTVHSGEFLVMDITTIGKSDPAAIAFVKYTLSKAGQAQYKQGGFTLLKPTGYGSGIPAAIKSELGS